ncbi:uncharacterized protein [Dermacentor andersoni]|uniref:uncharacterized protein isoform X3 n=1 Tax=Dermacentor andersoni TaxID=34620 RepID=UPI0024176022|nr:uncharacterized protein LOC129383447 isoform X2 [Dermacentor andersoni]
MKRNIAILVTTLLYISWTSERIVPCSSLAARRFKTRGPPKKGVGKFLYDNRHLYLVAMSEVKLGPPIRCMESDFHWSAGGHVVHSVYYEQKVENTDDAWEKKLLELAYTAESGNKYVELIVKGAMPLELKTMLWNMTDGAPKQNFEAFKPTPASYGLWRTV